MCVKAYIIFLLMILTSSRNVQAQDFHVSNWLQAPGWLLPAGVFYLILGAALMLATNISFHTQGRGTLAPWDAPKYVYSSPCSLTVSTMQCKGR